MKVTGFRKYILVLIFLAVGSAAYITSDKYNKLELYFDYLTFLAGIGILGSVGSKAMDKFGKKDIEP
jgi:hypothetical protein